MPLVSDEAADIRASDDERDAAAARLSRAVGHGELTLSEFSSRVDTVYAARTRGELDKVVADLPAVPEAGAAPATVPVQEGVAKPSWHVSLLGGMARKGRWRVPAKMIAVAIVGGVDLNLRDAELSAPETVLIKVALVGGVSIVVPRGVRVRVEGITLIGGRDIRVDEGAIHTGAPTIVIKAYVLLGGVSVKNG
jgi:DUF1707 SHOCT-like domain